MTFEVKVTGYTVITYLICSLFSAIVRPHLLTILTTTSIIKMFKKYYHINIAQVINSLKDGHTHACTHINFPNKSNFNKPGKHQPSENC